MDSSWVGVSDKLGNYREILELGTCLDISFHRIDMKLAILVSVDLDASRDRWTSENRID